ncbi:MAG: PEP-CTERM sorting domain-containing protein [Microcystis sp. M04BS1]|nr:PEP-CTERM sorting domain-containing protein [Microcystis sp. M04BS1]
MNKVAVITGLALTYFAVNVNSLQAANITYNFQGVITSGSLNGTYSGSASFDDAGITGIDFESTPLTNISFNLLDHSFNLASADAPPVANYFDGTFIGIDYSVTSTNAFFPIANFALTSGFNLSEAAFTYTPRLGAGGQGSLTFSKVPEPSIVIGLITLGGIGLVLRKSS